VNDDIHDLSGAYALDALDDIERARFAAHLAKCSTCQRDVAEFRAAATHLGRAVSEPPPPALRASILDAIGDVRQDRPGPPPRQPRHTGRWVTLAAAVAAALVIGVLTAQLLTIRADRNDTEQLAEVLTAPDAAIMPLEGEVGSGRMVWSPSLGRSVLVLDGLPTLESDRDYQLWFVVDGEQIPVEVYHPDDHRIVAETPDLPDGLEALGITEEPAGGSPAPTGPMLLTATA
jgi:anti-sigma-K factor RskA